MLYYHISDECTIRVFSFNNTLNFLKINDHLIRTVFILLRWYTYYEATIAIGRTVHYLYKCDLV